MYRFSLKSFSELPTQKDVSEMGEVIVTTKDKKHHAMNYTVEGGWNTSYRADGTLCDQYAIPADEMHYTYGGWLRRFSVSSENWYDEIMQILEEAQLLQREIGEERDDDMSNALDELVGLLDQAKDFAESFK